MTLDPRWKFPQGKSPEHLYDALYQLIRELRKGDYLQQAGLQRLAYGTVASAASLDIVLTNYTGYRALKFVLTGYVPETDNTDLHMLTSTDAGVSFDTGASDYAWAEFFLVATAGGTSGDAGDNADSKIQLGSGYGNGTGENASLEVTLYDRTSALTKLIEAMTVNHDQGGAIERSSFVGARLSTADIDAVRFIPSSGDIASVDWAVYGLL
jgi:hypothetical protein